MKKLLLASLLFLTACATATPSINQTPIDTAHINRKGQACTYFILGLFGPFGNNSVIKAAQNARMSKVLYYDITSEYWILFSRRCNHVYGY